MAHTQSIKRELNERLALSVTQLSLDAGGFSINSPLEEGLGNHPLA